MTDDKLRENERQQAESDESGDEVDNEEIGNPDMPISRPPTLPVIPERTEHSDNVSVTVVTAIATAAMTSTVTTAKYLRVTEEQPAPISSYFPTVVTNPNPIPFSRNTVTSSHHPVDRVATGSKDLDFPDTFNAYCYRCSKIVSFRMGLCTYCGTGYSDVPFHRDAIYDAENFNEFQNRGFTHFSDNRRRGLAILDRERSTVANMRDMMVARPAPGQGYPEQPPQDIPSFYSPMRPQPINHSTPRQGNYPQVSNGATLDWDYYPNRQIGYHQNTREPNFDKMLENARNDTLAKGLAPFDHIGDKYKIVPDLLGVQDERNAINAGRHLMNGVEFANRSARGASRADLEANPVAVFSGGGFINNAEAGRDARADMHEFEQRFRRQTILR